MRLAVADTLPRPERVASDFDRSDTRSPVVATDWERPRSTLIDRIGRSLEFTTGHVAEWDASAEP